MTRASSSCTAGQLQAAFVGLSNTEVFHRITQESLNRVVPDMAAAPTWLTPLLPRFDLVVRGILRCCLPEAAHFFLKDPMCA